MAIVNPTPALIAAAQTTKNDTLISATNSNIMQALIDIYKNNIINSIENDKLLYIENLDANFEVADKIKVTVTKGSCVFGNTKYNISNDFIFEFALPGAKTDYFISIYLDGTTNKFVNILATSMTDNGASIPESMWQGTYEATLNATLYPMAKFTYDPVEKSVEVTKIGLEIFSNKYNAIVNNVKNSIATIDRLDVTPDDILTKIKTVDGAGSGLDADTVDGLQADAFSQKAADETISGSKTFTNAKILITNLPTSDPKVKGQLYTDSSNNILVSQG